MARSGAKFGRKQEAAIVALLTQRNVNEAARVARMGTRTLLRWLQVPEFQEAYRKARHDAFSQSIARLQLASSAAVTALLRLLVDPSTTGSVRVRAAECIMHYATKGTESEDLEARVAELERDARGRTASDAAVECSTRHTLVSRLERLESQRVDAYFKTLPVDSAGERHVVIVRHERTGSGLEGCQCEERPGPAPPGSEDRGCDIYFTEDDPNQCAISEAAAGSPVEGPWLLDTVTDNPN